MTYRAFHVGDPNLRSTLGLPMDRNLFSLDELDQSQRFQAVNEIMPQMMKRPAAERSADEQDIFDRYGELYGVTMLFRQAGPGQSLLLVPPRNSSEDWHSLERAADESQKAGLVLPPVVTGYQEILGAYAANVPDRFNQAIAAYEGRSLMYFSSSPGARSL